MGSPLADAKSARGATRARPRRSLPPPSSVTETTIRWRDHPPGLSPRGLSRSTPEVEGRTARRPAIMTEAHRRPHPLPPRQFQALFDSFSKSFSSFPQGRQGPAQRVVTLSGAPFHGTCAVRQQDASADYTERAKSRRFSYRALPRSPPLLGESFWCSHLTWGRIRARPPGHGGNRRAGGSSSEPGPRHDFEPRRAREGGATTVAAGALGAKCFSANLARGARTTTSARLDDSPHRLAGGQQGTGGENTPGATPRQVYP
ncbi:hypothetical protein H6P81_021703 [Aristolochia fimbriata]|uniref:Uncharacterized protein n=1 Tax=Aristolochia fimbriata TaxID=158543 RepID=A0AAV7DS89_ARIFI|nr:hypothetical protein H6P81_021703 [Aristolochia fimbriata]